MTVVETPSNEVRKKYVEDKQSPSINAEMKCFKDVVQEVQNVQQQLEDLMGMDLG